MHYYRWPLSGGRRQGGGRIANQTWLPLFSIFTLQKQLPFNDVMLPVAVIQITGLSCSKQGACRWHFHLLPRWAFLEQITLKQSTDWYCGEQEEMGAGAYELTRFVFIYFYLYGSWSQFIGLSIRLLLGEALSLIGLQVSVTKKKICAQSHLSKKRFWLLLVNLDWNSAGGKHSGGRSSLGNTIGLQSNVL